MVSSAAMIVRSNLNWNSAQNSDRHHHVMDQRRDPAQRELPFEAQPDVDHDPRRRGQNGGDCLQHQLARGLRPDAFGVRERHRRVGGFQRRFDLCHDLGRDRLGPVLRLDADHRDMLVGAEGRVEHFGDRDIAKVQGRHCLAVAADIEDLGGFGADRGPAPEVDAEVQAHDQNQHDRGKGCCDRKAEGQPLPAEEVVVGLFGNDAQTPGHIRFSLRP